MTFDDENEQDISPLEFSKKYHFDDWLKKCQDTFEFYTEQELCDVIIENLKEKGIPATNLRFKLDKTCIATVKTSEKLTNKQIEKIKDELTWQYSEGFGETILEAFVGCANKNGTVYEIFIDLYPENFKMTVS